MYELKDMRKDYFKLLKEIVRKPERRTVYKDAFKNIQEKLGDAVLLDVAAAAFVIEASAQFSDLLIEATTEDNSKTCAQLTQLLAPVTEAKDEEAAKASVKLFLEAWGPLMYRVKNSVAHDVFGYPSGMEKLIKDISKELGVEISQHSKQPSLSELIKELVGTKAGRDEIKDLF